MLCLVLSSQPPSKQSSHDNSQDPEVQKHHQNNNATNCKFHVHWLGVEECSIFLVFLGQYW